MVKTGERINKPMTPPAPISLKQGVLFNTAGSLTYQVGLWLTTVLVVLLSGYYDSGILAFAMATANMFNAIATYSIRVYQVSDVAEKYTQPNYIAFRIMTILTGFLIIIPYVLIVANDSNIVIGTLMFLLFKTDEAFCDVLYGIDQKGERLDYVGISQFIRGVLVVVLFAGCLVLFNNLLLAILAMYISCLCVTVIYDIPHAARFALLAPRITIRQIRSLFLECLPVVVSTLFIGCVVAVPRQYYGIAYGADLLGIYAAIATPAVLIQAAARYMYGPALVPLAKKWVSDPKGSFRSFLKRTTAILALGSIVMVVVLSLIGGPCLELVFGEKVSSQSFIFPYVLIGTALIAFVWFFTDVLVICRDMKGLVIASVISMVISLCSMVPFISLFDMNGINVVVIVSMLGGALFAGARLIRQISLAPEEPIGDNV